MADIDISVGVRPIALLSRLTEADRAAHAGLVGIFGEKALRLKVAGEPALLALTYAVSRIPSVTSSYSGLTRVSMP